MRFYTTLYIKEPCFHEVFSLGQWTLPPIFLSNRKLAHPAVTAQRGGRDPRGEEQFGSYECGI